MTLSSAQQSWMRANNKNNTINQHPINMPARTRPYTEGAAYIGMNARNQASYPFGASLFHADELAMTPDNFDALSSADHSSYSQDHTDVLSTYSGACSSDVDDFSAHYYFGDDMSHLSVSHVASQHYNPPRSAPAMIEAFPPPVHGKRKASLHPLMDQPNGKRRSPSPKEENSISRKRDGSSVSDKDIKSEVDEDAQAEKIRDARHSHCFVERRYRQNMNAKFDTLRTVLAELHRSTSSTASGSPGITVDLSMSPAASEMRGSKKGDVLDAATNYIRESERSRNMLMQHVAFLQNRVATLEKLVRCQDCDMMKQITRMKFQQ